jgi:3-dehydroquinate synthase
MYHELKVQREGDFTYSIFFREDFRELSKEILALHKNFRKICIVTDSNVAPLYLEEVTQCLESCGCGVTAHILPAGEENKTLQQVQEIYTHLIENHFDRKDLLLALGGGVVGDMTGYAAATYLRGIDFIQVPTTLLAQVDSSIGGKTGVDFEQYKNMVGAFHQPVMVYMNVSVLQSLTPEQFSCGMGEILKHGLIRDYSYYAWTNFHKKEILAREPKILTEMIYRSCVIKKTVVENDPTEQGERAVLNMGHTVGHAVEKLKNFSLLHGQCVALGMVASAYLSFKKGYISPEEFAQIQKDLRAFGLPTRVEGLPAEAVLLATKSDKKMEHGKIKFILMDALGHAVIDTGITDSQLLDAITVIEAV